MPCKLASRNFFWCSWSPYSVEAYIQVGDLSCPVLFLLMCPGFQALTHLWCSLFHQNRSLIMNFKACRTILMRQPFDFVLFYAIIYLKTWEYYLFQFKSLSMENVNILWSMNCIYIYIYYVYYFSCLFFRPQKMLLCNTWWPCSGGT